MDRGSVWQHHDATPLVRVADVQVTCPPKVETRAREQNDETLGERWKRGGFTIVPDGNPIIDVWDVMMMLGLGATAFVVPYEVALVEEPPPGLVMFDTVVSLIFVVDIVLTFNMAFTDSGFRSQGGWERSPFKIAKHYMAFPFSDNFNAGWFWPDLLTVMPWDHILTGKNAASVRMVRVVRLLRMFRLVRVIKLFVRGHTKYGFSFALVRIVRCLMVTILFVHWLACFWAHLGLHAEEYTGSEEDGCWLSATNLAQEKRISDFTSAETYSLALYFCVVVLTTVGFGDLLPINRIETSAMTVTVFLTGLTWAWVVANVVGVISNMDMFSLSFNQAMDDLNRLMEYQEVDNSLQMRVRRHMHEAYMVHQSRHHWQTISWLSPMLQGELAVLSGKDLVCDCIWYFRGLRRGQWVTDLVCHFKPELYSADETILDRSSVSVIRRGQCAKKGKLLMRDAIFGEDMILATEFLKDSSCPRTLTIVEVMKLSRSGLFTVCQRHHSVNLSVRRAQVRLAVCRALVLLASKLKRREQTGQGWTDRDFKSLAQNFRMGFVQHFHGGGVGAIAVPANPMLEEIGNQIRDIGGAVGQMEAATNFRMATLSKKVGDIDRRTHELAKGTAQF